MKQRSPLAVFFLPFITLGIYSLVWEVKTKNEMNQLGASIPTAWLLIIPIVNLYWIWKYSEGVEKATGGQTSAVLAFVLLFLLGIIGMAIIQSEFNKVGAGAAAQAVAGAPVPVPGSPTEIPVTNPMPPVSDNQFAPTPPAPAPETPAPPTFPTQTPPTVG